MPLFRGYANERQAVFFGLEQAMGSGLPLYLGIGYPCPMADHDHSYKQLFSHPELVRDLLNGFVQEEWIDDLDLSTLEKTHSSYVSDDLREREDDAIWRVRCRDQWIYVYILIEFQSTVDRFMAVRLMTYIGLLYQDLIRTGQLSDNGKLSPVFPLVLYNGKQAWNGATSVQDLIQNVWINGVRLD